MSLGTPASLALVFGVPAVEWTRTAYFFATSSRPLPELRSRTGKHENKSISRSDKHFARACSEYWNTLKHAIPKFFHQCFFLSRNFAQNLWNYLILSLWCIASGTSERWSDDHSTMSTLGIPSTSQTYYTVCAIVSYFFGSLTPTAIVVIH